MRNTKATPETKQRAARNGYAAYLAMEAETQCALEAGRTLSDIYLEKSDRLQMSYSQFARYAKELRRMVRAQRAASGALRLQRALPRARESPQPLRSGPRRQPLRARSDDAVPTLDMDRFAIRSLKVDDLF